MRRERLFTLNITTYVSLQSRECRSESIINAEIGDRPYFFARASSRVIFDLQQAGHS